MKSHPLRCLIFLAAASGRVGAQSVDPAAPRPALPTGPAVETAPDFSAWTVVRQTIPGLGGQTVDLVARNAASSAPPDSLTNVTKTGQVRRQVRKLKSGQQEEVWCEHGNRITMESGWKIPMFEVATAPAGQPQGPDFPELSWVVAGNFVGTRTYQGVNYLVFESHISDGNAEAARALGNKPTMTIARAYVNAETRLPWLLQTGDVLYRYVFQAPPVTPVEVPTAFQVMFDTFEKRKIESARRPVAP